MKLYKDIETNNIITESQLMAEFETLKAEDSETYNYAFNEYINNCTNKNGTLEEIENNYIFTFEWVHGNRCFNDYVIEWAKNKNIDFCFDGFNRLCVEVYRNNHYYILEHERINGDLYGVFVSDKMHIYIKNR